jgi:membrane-associated protein
VAQSEAFFHRFGTLAIFLARFVAPIRAVVPITAGALDVPPARFYAVNIPAVVLWACAHVLPGVFAVELLHRYGGIPHHSHVAKPIWIALVIVGSALAWLAIRQLRRRRESRLLAQAGE